MADRFEMPVIPETIADPGSGEFEQLLDAPLAGAPAQVSSFRVNGVRIGTIVGLANDGATPLVTFAGQPTAAAQSARSTLDIHAEHIGASAVLVFEDGDSLRPVIVGVLRDTNAMALSDAAGQVKVEADGRRLTVSAEEQLVLRCGKASITLTKQGKVILQGAYVSSHASGVLRIKGGSVHIN